MYKKDLFRFAIHLDIPLYYTTITVGTYETPSITQPACRCQHLQMHIQPLTFKTNIQYTVNTPV